MAPLRVSTTKSEWLPDDPTAFVPTRLWKLPFIKTWDDSRNQNRPTASAEQAQSGTCWLPDTSRSPLDDRKRLKSRRLFQAQPAAEFGSHADKHRAKQHNAGWFGDRILTRKVGF